MFTNLKIASVGEDVGKPTLSVDGKNININLLSLI